MLGGIAQFKNIGAALDVVQLAQALRTGVAETAITTASFDRLPPLPSGAARTAQQYESMVLAISAVGNITAAATLSLTISVEHADVNTAGTAAGTFAAAPSTHQPAAALVVTGAGALAAVYRYDLRLTELKRFIRFVITPDYSIANVSETATLNVVGVLGGAHNLATRSVNWTPTYQNS